MLIEEKKHCSVYIKTYQKYVPLNINFYFFLIWKSEGLFLELFFFPPKYECTQNSKPVLTLDVVFSF